MNEYEATAEDRRWGLPLAEIEQLGQRLVLFFERFRSSFRSKTHDASESALRYVSGLLRMKAKRNMAEIGRKTGFQSGAVLAVDESAEEKAGEPSAGASRQHNGRLGKVEMSQAGVFLSLVPPRANTWIDGELFLAERWFTPAYAERRARAGIPKERSFKTKAELAWQMIQRAQANGVPFEAVVMDDLYGRNVPLRQRLHQAGIEYYGDVPANTLVYLDKPQVVYPLTRETLEKAPNRGPTTA